MTDNVGKYICIDGMFCLCDNDCNETTDILKNIEEGSDIIARIYEVVRYIDGVPVFWEEHFERFKSSLLNYSYNADMSEMLSLEKECFQLVQKSGLLNCNVQITYYIRENGVVNKVSYVKKHFYPTYEMYKSGVETDIVYIERQDPNVKNWIPEYKAAVQAALGDNFEVLLVNGSNEILEGSRSNFFYVKDGMVYTSPQNLVLNGITRINILRAIERCGFKIVERSLNVSDIDKIEGAFLSGTSLNVLPIKCIGSRLLSNNGFSKVVANIMDAFENTLTCYVKEKKKTDLYKIIEVE